MMKIDGSPLPMLNSVEQVREKIRMIETLRELLILQSLLATVCIFLFIYFFKKI